MSTVELEEKRRSITATLAIPHEAIRIVAPPPDTLSQRNVEAVTGIPARIYLEAVRRPGFPLRVSRLGKLRIVNRVAFVAWIEGTGRSVPTKNDAATTIAAPSTDSEPLEDAEPASAILTAVGLQARSPSPRSSPKTLRRGRRA